MDLQRQSMTQKGKLVKSLQYNTLLEFALSTLIHIYQTQNGKPAYKKGLSHNIFG